MVEVCDAAEIARITFHAAARHAFATRLGQAGWSTKRVATTGGWEDAQVVEKIYTHLQHEGREAAEITAKDV